MGQGRAARRDLGFDGRGRRGRRRDLLLLVRFLFLWDVAALGAGGARILTLRGGSATRPSTSRFNAESNGRVILGDTRHARYAILALAFWLAVHYSYRNFGAFIAHGVQCGSWCDYRYR